MAMRVPQTGFRTMLKEGTKHFSGVEEAIMRNITACRELGAIVRTSFGPNGMNKMIVNHLDKLFVTSDAATIIKELEVEHPAAKLLVLASQQQEAEVGDGTNFVMIFGARLLEKAEALLQMGLAPAEIVAGYEMACDKALEMLPDLVCSSLSDYRNPEEVARALLPPLSCKQAGREEFLSKLVAKACIDVCPKGDKPFNVDNVRVVKILGAGVLSSTVVRGMVFHRESQSSVKTASNAKVVVYQCAIDWMQTETKGTVLIKNAEELKSFSKGEEELLESQIKAIADTGANVLVTGVKIGEMAQHFLNRYGLMGVKLVSKHELRRLCSATGATPLPRLTPPAASEMGRCDNVCVEEIGDTTVTVFRQDDDSPVSTIVIRGATANIMDDVERAVDDGVNVYKLLTMDQRMLPGAGATEIELARSLLQFASTKKGLEQYAITAFAEALECVPHVLAENAGIKAQDVVSRLYAAHEKGEKYAGFDNQADLPAVKDVVQAGILENFKTKFWGLRFASNAATTILRVDQIIMAKKAGGPKAPKDVHEDHDD